LLLICFQTLVFFVVIGTPTMALAGQTYTITLSSAGNILGVLVAVVQGGNAFGSFTAAGKIKLQNLCTGDAAMSTVTHNAVINAKSVPLTFNIPAGSSGQFTIQAVMLIGTSGGGSSQTFYSLTKTVTIDPPASAPAANVNFFITSVGKPTGGNLGGLAGADAHCTMLAKNAGVGAAGLTWVAYLSNVSPRVNARDRIGSGPWFNYKGVIFSTLNLFILKTTIQKGVKLADDLNQLHAANGAMSLLGKNNTLNELGYRTNGRGIAL
jgi:hypothetical protein